MADLAQRLVGAPVLVPSADFSFRLYAIVRGDAHETPAADDECKLERTSDSCPLPDEKREPKGA
jgi:hypothetical protein